MISEFVQQIGKFHKIFDQVIEVVFVLRFATNAAGFFVLIRLIIIPSLYGCGKRSDMSSCSKVKSTKNNYL